MFTDLFSSMDGMISIMNWIPLMIFITLLMYQKIWTLEILSSSLHTNFNTWNKSKSTTFISKTLFLSSVMIFIVLNNLMGLSPFSFGVTSHMWSNLSMALFIWFFLLISGFFYKFKSSMAHLLPSGAPMGLSPFLILIETVSIIIRPLTLTVRLMANISAGHIVLALISNVLVSSLNSMPSYLLMLLMTFYYMFEYFVAIIQGYIFTLLISLYMEEHP
uniref:ATP synthase F0 subunit 6 n=1 Tax=Succinea arundinetorum TaxID=2981998 RepID=UPI00226CB847|nr:ATP synthase F0 subunit 6 [Succinea arundinetorum]UZH97773.1 ATP synthase F0 subunit 6 [Succinea arundinetorum]